MPAPSFPIEDITEPISPADRGVDRGVDLGVEEAERVIGGLVRPVSSGETTYIDCVISDGRVVQDPKSGD